MAHVRPCIFVMASLLLSVPLAGALAYGLGRQWENSRRYLSSYYDPKVVAVAGAETEWAVLMDYVLHSEENNPVIFLGDSTCMEGCVPNSFEELTGLRAYNLGQQAVLGIEGNILVLGRYLERHPRPRLVVLTISAPSLQNPSLMSPEAEQVIDQFKWCYGPGTEELRPKHAAPIAYFVRLGILAARIQLQDSVGYYTSEFKKRAANRARVRGYHEELGKARKSAERPHYLESREALSPVMMAPLARLIRLTQENGIPMLIRLAPVIQGAGPIDTRFVEAWPAEIEARFAGVTVSRPLILHEDESHFVDSIHCNRAGAEKLTARIAKEVLGLLHTK